MLNLLSKMPKIAPAKIVSQRSHVVAGKLKVTEHFFEVPKDYHKPEAGTIQVFARSVKKNELPIIPEKHKEKDQLPWMLYLQGGPGFRCATPQTYPWTHTILDKGYQMLYLDQRGTGLSTPITASTLQMRGDNAVQAKYLKLYRADNIVRDCEAIRQALTQDYPEEKKQWSIMGQSFGGFCCITYLSFHPQGVREAFLFGGLAPITATPDQVYRALYPRIHARNTAYYQKYPEDIPRVRKIHTYLSRFGDGKIKLPSEGSLTRRRFRQLGIMFGGHGGLDAVHDIVLRASNDIEAFGHLTRLSLGAIDRAMPFDEAVIYAILHEPIYCQGNVAAGWSAHRVMEDFPAFDLDRTASPDSSDPILFTGETVYPWMFTDYSELRKLEDVANLVAADKDWPALYDEAQLAKNEVPVYAASYVEDMYVDFDLARETARRIKGCKTFTTNVMFHDAIRSKMDEVVRQAFALRDDVVE